MRISILFITIIGFISLLKGQNPTFSTILPSYKTHGGVTPFEFDNGYLIFSISRITQSEGFGFTQINKEGQLQWQKYFPFDEDRKFVLKSVQNCAMLDSTTMIICGTVERTDTLKSTFRMIFFDIPSRDTFNVKNIETPYFIEPTSVKILEDEIIVLARKSTYQLGANGGIDAVEGKMIIMRFDRVGNFLEEILIPESRRFVLSNHLSIIPDKGFIISYVTADEILFPDRFKMAYLDTNFNVQWTRQRIVNIYQYRYPVVTNIEDSIFVFGAAASYRNFSQLPIPTQLFAYDDSGDSIWHTRIPSDPTILYTDNLITCTNGDIVGAGQNLNSVHYLGGSGTANLYRLSKDGSLLWQRDYWNGKQGLTEYLFDNVIQTTDGGFFAVGSYYADDPSDLFEIYAVKLDSDGCLNPNCGDLVYTSTNDLTTQRIFDFKVYPNPSSTVLKVSFKKPIEDYLKLNLSNSIGKIVFEKNIRKGETTIEIPTKELVMGIYNISLYRDAKIIRTDRFIKID